jgi:hypothetical protein
MANVCSEITSDLLETAQLRDVVEDHDCAGNLTARMQRACMEVQVPLSGRIGDAQLALTLRSVPQSPTQYFDHGVYACQLVYPLACGLTWVNAEHGSGGLVNVHDPLFGVHSNYTLGHALQNAKQFTAVTLGVHYSGMLFLQKLLERPRQIVTLPAWKPFTQYILEAPPAVAKGPHAQLRRSANR